jgi:hypothetical protein
VVEHEPFKLSVAGSTPAWLTTMKKIILLFLVAFAMISCVKQVEHQTTRNRSSQKNEVSSQPYQTDNGMANFWLMYALMSNNEYNSYSRNTYNYYGRSGIEEENAVVERESPIENDTEEQSFINTEKETTSMQNEESTTTTTTDENVSEDTSSSDSSSSDSGGGDGGGGGDD